MPGTTTDTSTTTTTTDTTVTEIDTDYTFDVSDKITYNELAPTLQDLLDNAITRTEFEQLESEVEQLMVQIGDNRISIVGNVQYIASPKNKKELALETSSTLVYGYDEEWIPGGGVYL